MDSLPCSCPDQQEP